MSHSQQKLVPPRIRASPRSAFVGVLSEKLMLAIRVRGRDRWPARALPDTSHHRCTAGSLACADARHLGCRPACCFPASSCQRRDIWCEWRRPQTVHGLTAAANTQANMAALPTVHRFRGPSTLKPPVSLPDQTHCGRLFPVSTTLDFHPPQPELDAQYR